MKKKNLMLIMAAAVLALTACNNDEEMNLSPAEITIDATMESATRATATAFEQDDAISVYAWRGDIPTEQNSTLWINGETNTYDGSSWSAENPMTWYNNEDAHYFIGVYPVMSITNFTAHSFDLADENLVSKDLMIAKNYGTSDGGLIQSSDAVALPFNHCMAKLIVNLSFRSEFDQTTVAATSVSVDAKSGVTVNFLTQTVNASESGTASTADLTKESSSTETWKETWSGIVVPQSITKVDVVVSGETYTYAPTGGITLLQGKYTTLNLTVGREKITAGNITINNWDSAGEPTTGEAL